MCVRIPGPLAMLLLLSLALVLAPATYGQGEPPAPPPTPAPADAGEARSTVLELPSERGLPPPADSDDEIAPQQELPPLAPQQLPSAFFGSNLYLTGLERNDRDDRELLADLAWQGGARWTREEIVWAEIERNRDRYLTFYDRHLRTLARRRFGITGMLVTTPEWARLERCRRATYYCPPADVGEFAQFAAWAAERYDGDGYLDPRESPRIAAWEIWNEPNFQETWPGTPAEYAALLVAGYGAIKGADPTATVLVGGVYVFDGSSGDDGLAFLERAFAANPAAYHSFDVLSIHPYLPTVAPDDPGVLRLVTLEGRVRSAQARLARWAQRYGGAPKPLWVTEVGWCTASAYCQGSEALDQERQASYTVRALALLKALGVAHVDWFQFEDKFDGGSKLKWGDMAVVGTRAEGYAPKLAYHSYRAAQQQLGSTSFAGYGPLHTHRYDPARPYARDGGGRYHLVFVHPNGTRVDVLWQTTGASALRLPVGVPAHRLALVERDGGASGVVLRAGAADLTVSERPIYLRQEAAPLLEAPDELRFLVEAGEPGIAGAQINLRNLGGSSFAWAIAGLPPWLRAEPQAASAPGTATLLVDPQALAPGLNAATLTVTASPEGGQQQIRVQALLAASVERAHFPLLVR
jgi:hypothetical protein